MHKCTSWLGHRFEARYDSHPPRGSFEYTGYDISDYMNSLVKKIYIHDICTRCGTIVSKET